MYAFDTKYTTLFPTYKRCTFDAYICIYICAYTICQLLLSQDPVCLLFCFPTIIYIVPMDLKLEC